MGTLLGKNGDNVKSTAAKIGATSLFVVGRDATSSTGDNQTRDRCRFSCKGSIDALSKLPEALEDLMDSFHEKLASRATEKKPDVPEKESRKRRRATSPNSPASRRRVAASTN